MCRCQCMFILFVLSFYVMRACVFSNTKTIRLLMNVKFVRNINWHKILHIWMLWTSFYMILFYKLSPIKFIDIVLFSPMSSYFSIRHILNRRGDYVYLLQRHIEQNSIPVYPLSFGSFVRSFVRLFAYSRFDF